MRIVGIVPAAGAGRRMGLPKALLRHGSGDGSGTSFVAAAAEVLRQAGCACVLVTVGARAGEVRAELPAGVVAVDVPDWADGPGAGIARALQHPEAVAADATVLLLVDLPHVTVEGVRAVVAAGGRGTLVRAVDAGRPGHPVLVGADLRERAVATARGGQGLKPLFTDPAVAHAVVRVEVPGAVADVDEPSDLPPGATFGRRSA